MKYPQLFHCQIVNHLWGLKITSRIEKRARVGFLAPHPSEKTPPRRCVPHQRKCIGASASHASTPAQRRKRPSLGVSPCRVYSLSSDKGKAVRRRYPLSRLYTVYHLTKNIPIGGLPAPPRSYRHSVRRVLLVRSPYRGASASVYSPNISAISSSAVGVCRRSSSRHASCVSAALRTMRVSSVVT